MAEDTWNEPDITINGTKLTTAQAMTVRVALGSFALSLRPVHALGEDEQARRMRLGYQAILAEVLRLIHDETPAS